MGFTVRPNSTPTLHHDHPPPKKLDHRHRLDDDIPGRSWMRHPPPPTANNSERRVTLLVNCPRVLGSNSMRDRATARGSRTRWMTRRLGSFRSSGSIESIVARTDFTARRRRLEHADRNREMHCLSTCIQQGGTRHFETERVRTSFPLVNIAAGTHGHAVV